MKDLGLVLGKGLATIALITTLFGSGCGDNSKTTFSGKIGEEKITLNVRKELGSEFSSKTNYRTFADIDNYTLTSINENKGKQIKYYWKEFEGKRTMVGIEVFYLTHHLRGPPSYELENFYSARDRSISPAIEKAKLKVENYVNMINSTISSKKVEAEKDRINQALKDLD